MDGVQEAWQQLLTTAQHKGFEVWLDMNKGALLRLDLSRAQNNFRSVADGRSGNGATVGGGVVVGSDGDGGGNVISESAVGSRRGAAAPPAPVFAFSAPLPQEAPPAPVAAAVATAQPAPPAPATRKTPPGSSIERLEQW